MNSNSNNIKNRVYKRGEGFTCAHHTDTVLPLPLASHYLTGRDPFLLSLCTTSGSIEKPVSPGHAPPSYCKN